MLPEYRIVVPSRKRTHNVEKILTMLPTATIYVDERELDDYAAAGVPADHLVGHKPTKSISEVRNCINKDFKEPWIVQIDDDIRGIRLMSKASRLRKDPLEILTVIENGIQVACDLGIDVVCWSRSYNTMYFNPFDPVDFSPMVSSSFIVGNKAREIRYDERLVARTDIDFTCEVLRELRVILGDRRFYFDHGPIFSGRGGNVDLIDAKAYEGATEKLAKKWGRYVSIETASKGRGSGTNFRTNVQSASIRVRRRNPIARNHSN